RLVEHLTLRTEELDMQGHTAKSMSGAAQTRVIAANDRLDTVEHVFLQAGTFHIMLRDLTDTQVHGQAIVASGNDHVHPFDQPIFVNFVMMNQRSPWRFGDTDTFQFVWLSESADMPIENVGLIKDLFDPFDSVKYFD